jgi:N-acyl amino acid synthase FeeM
MPNSGDPCAFLGVALIEPLHPVKHYRVEEFVSGRPNMSALKELRPDSRRPAKAPFYCLKTQHGYADPGTSPDWNVVPMPLRDKWTGMEGRNSDNNFRMFVAFDAARRERAFRLAFRVYRDCGYVVDTPTGRLSSKFDAQASTLVLLAQDAAGNDAATVSLIFDSPAGLPSDEVRAADLAPLRAQGRRLVEVTRLAIDQDYVGSKPLLVQLINTISIYARHAGGTDFIIEVHPHHANYYRRMMLFEPAGPQRACPRVNGSPGILLRLDLAMQEAEIAIVGGTQGKARGPHGRTLYSQFWALDREPQLAYFMRSQQQLFSAAHRHSLH